MNILFKTKSKKNQSKFENARQVVLQKLSDLNIEEKLKQKSIEELKTLAFRLLTLSAIEIRRISFEQRDKPIVLSVILHLSDGIHNLPALIENVGEDNKPQHLYYQKHSLEMEVFSAIEGLLVSSTVYKLHQDNGVEEVLKDL